MHVSVCACSFFLSYNLLAYRHKVCPTVKRGRTLKKKKKEKRKKILGRKRERKKKL